jgi:hypothetical protein
VEFRCGITLLESMAEPLAMFGEMTTLEFEANTTNLNESITVKLPMFWVFAE